MPPSNATGRKPAQRSVKRDRRRTLTPSHKRALSEGRTLSATVNRYLEAVRTPKRRGRKVSKATLERRLENARTQFKSGAGVEKLLAAQEIRDLRARIKRLEATAEVDLKSLEASFVKIAKKFSENRGVTYGAWRDAGVPAQVLKQAGVKRTRS
jgi:hypothetical protein